MNKLFLTIVFLVVSVLSGCGNNDPAPKTLWEEKLNLWCNEANWKPGDSQRFAELTIKMLPAFYMKDGRFISQEMQDLYNKNNSKYHVDNCPANSSGSSNVSEKSKPEISELSKTADEVSGVWIINEEKSKAECNKIEDESSKIICTGGVNGAVLGSINSDGVLIENNTMQDGPNVCNLEVRNEQGYKYSCINQLDRTIYARLKVNQDGTLSFGVSMLNLILDRK